MGVDLLSEIGFEIRSAATICCGRIIRQQKEAHLSGNERQRLVSDHDTKQVKELMNLNDQKRNATDGDRYSCRLIRLGYKLNNHQLRIES